MSVGSGDASKKLWGLSSESESNPSKLSGSSDRVSIEGTGVSVKPSRRGALLSLELRRRGGEVGSGGKTGLRGVRV